jgi:hypothetical protein
MKNWFYKLAIRRALLKKSPTRIPLSGGRVFLRNYYTASLGDDENRWRFLVQSEVADGFSGNWFERIDGEAEERIIEFNNIAEYDVLIVHYYKELEIRFSSAIEFWLNSILYMHSLRYAVYRISLFWLARKNLSRAKRLQVLQLFHDKSMEDWDYAAGPESVMTELYGPSWRRHPDNARLFRYYELVLKSLVESGDLESKRHQYVMKPKALHTLFVAEQDETRHTDNRKQQKYIIFLTVVLAIVGILQVISPLVVDVIKKQFNVD